MGCYVRMFWTREKLVSIQHKVVNFETKPEPEKEKWEMGNGKKTNIFLVVRIVKFASNFNKIIL